jgi:hypothetical protein
MTREHPLIHEGLIAGALGALAVAVWFLILDAAHGRLLFTPAALGSAVFLGARSPEDVQITAGTVLAYTFLHVLIFMAIGFLGARLMASADEEPRVLLGAGVLVVTLEVAALGAMAFAAAWLLDALQLWAILVANVIAAAVIGFYLYRAHPLVRRDLRTNLEDRDLTVEDAVR